MNRNAYLTTGLAIKALSNLTKADVVLHGGGNIPDGPTIFVINHFTRIETLLLPYYIYRQTDKPVWSLAHSGLFQGGLERFFDMVGVISTADPKRDELIVRSLLTNEANWIIFPEGSMVKTKQVMERGKFMVAGPTGVRRPHTGAAALALRSELFRRRLLNAGLAEDSDPARMLEFFDMESIEQVSTSSTSIVPVNLTYYPVRARENVMSTLASKMVKDLSERMVEEIMIEGTMLLSGVDIDVRFGEPINIASYLERPAIQGKLKKQDISGFMMSPELKDAMKLLADEIMQRYMTEIYNMTTVNHEHLFASFLRMVPFKQNCERGLRKRVFLAASKIAATEHKKLYIHKSLRGSQAHLLTDDRYDKFDNFLKLALEKKVLKKKDGCLEIDRSRLAAPISFHRSRIDNPIEMMANEIEPLSKLHRLLVLLAIQPNILLRFNILRTLYVKGTQQYRQDYIDYGYGDDLERKRLGKPFLLPGLKKKKGVVLIHSYLSAPAEVKELGYRLWRRGYWVYGLRLPGHGTSSRDLAGRKHGEWIEAVEEAYVLMRSVCRSVVLCGVSVGASLALEAASRIKGVAGVVAVSPPLRLQDYSTNFMPSTDTWKRIVKRLRGGEQEQFFDFIADNPHVNYRKNPYAGILEVGDLLDQLESRLTEVKSPVLIVQGDKNPVINEASSRKVYERLQSEEKQFELFSFDRHVLINGDGAEKVRQSITSFINRL
ncbi:alpha/beta fold hydrolase [Desulfopila sp. IMCC35008]|uniref:alpha/beta fold hydrolase n=1 Tax=Desulfopila sp. IMCC35008 TaxID=2653858 RepID=UPI0013D0C62E|nr:alpha/beta fold hydrolase [Desulfopila sp. IMCC35008]